MRRHPERRIHPPLYSTELLVSSSRAGPLSRLPSFRRFPALLRRAPSSRLPCPQQANTSQPLWPTPTTRLKTVPPSRRDTSSILFEGCSCSPRAALRTISTIHSSLPACGSPMSGSLPAWRTPGRGGEPFVLKALVRGPSQITIRTISVQSKTRSTYSEWPRQTASCFGQGRSRTSAECSTRATSGPSAARSSSRATTPQMIGSSSGYRARRYGDWQRYPACRANCAGATAAVMLAAINSGCCPAPTRAGFGR